jgi:hypothetical protein
VSTVNPITDKTFCSGDASGVISFGSPVAGTTFTWVNTNPVIGLGPNGTTNSISFTAATVAAQTVGNITVTPAANGCEGTPLTFKVTVNPVPAAPTATHHEKCPVTTATSIAWSSLLSNYTGILTWYSSSTSSPAGDPGVFDASVPQTASYWVSQTVSGCESPRAEVRVNISANPPTPTITPYVICVEVNGTNKTWRSIVTSNTTDKLTWYSADSDAAELPTEPAAFNTGTPLSLTTNYVVIEDNGGCKTNRAPVTVHIKPRPTAILSGGATICNGQTASLTVTFTGSPSFKFTYSDGTTTFSEITTMANPHIINSIAPSSTKNYSLASLSDAQCTAVTSDLSGSATITVNDPPTLGALSPIAALCLGDLLTEPSKPLVDDKGSPLSGDRWEIGQSGSFGPITFPYKVSASDNGKTLRFIAVNSCGESTPVETSITVNSLPVINITTSSAILTCAIPTITLTATGGDIYAWDKGLGNTANAIVTVADTYTVTVTDVNNCTNTKSIEITENKTLPDAGIDNISGTIELTCTKPTINLEATGGLSYSWDNGLGNNAEATVTSAGFYTVEVMAANGCKAIASITITADGSMPTAGITNNTGTKVLTCNTTSISLTAFGGISFLWDNGLGNNANVDVTKAGTYTVTVTADNGCSASEKITITEDKTLPSVVITTNTGTNELTCTTQNIILTATGGVSYSWDNSLGNNATAIVNSTGTYTVTVTGTNGCTATESITITADASIPTVHITTNTGTRELTCITPAIILTASGGVTYSWDNKPDNSNSASITVNTAGIYTVTVKSENGCDAIESIAITSNQSPPTINVNGAEICLDSKATLMASGADSYTWTPSGGLNITTGASVTASPTTTTTYTVEGMVTATGCKNRATATVYVETPIELTLEAPKSVELGNEITITVITARSDHGNFEWFINNESYRTTAADEKSITFQPGAGKQHYSVTTETTKLHCPSSSEGVTVSVTESVSNAINPYSPSGKNCCFMRGYRVEIYNRYMQKVFEGGDGWDGIYRGSLADPGTYFYRLYKKDGEVEKGTLEVVKF